MKTIPEIMLRDHARLHNLIQEVKHKIPEDTKESHYLFIKLKWNLEKHFFIEEKVVFHIFSKLMPEESQELSNLLIEHKSALLLLQRIDQDFKNSGNFLEQLDKLLTAHANFEDKILYQRLEQQLSKEQKKLIFDRCEKFL